MNLVATPWTIIAVFKVLDNTGLTECMEAFCHRGGLDQISFTDVAGDVRVEIFHQVFPLGSHSWSAGFSSSSRGALRGQQAGPRSSLDVLVGVLRHGHEHPD